MGDDSRSRSVAAALTGQLLADPGVLAAFSQELNGMIGKSSGYIESLPGSVKRRLKALKKLQVEIFKLESAFHEEVHALECKYAALYEPLHDKRRGIVNAVFEPTDEDCNWASDEEEESENPESEITEAAKCNACSETENDHKETDVSDDTTEGVPEFWLTVLKNVEDFANLLTEHDEDILRSLLDIQIKCTNKPDMGFQVDFIFGPNDHFTNDVLTKKYYMRCSPDSDRPLRYDGPEIVRCEGCAIDWKPGKNITEKKMKEKQSGVKSTKKFITKVVKVDSFFNFFSVCSDLKDEVEDEEVVSQLEADFELGRMLRECIVPRAVLYFTGDAIDSASGSEDEGDDGSDDNGNNENGSGEEDDPDYVPPKNMKDGPPNCRQQ